MQPDVTAPTLSSSAAQGGRVSKEELEYVYMDEFPHGITYSQLVTKVNDVLYTGYTNVSGSFALSELCWCAV